MNKPFDLALVRLDPWGPVSTVLYEIGDSDFVQDAIGMTGLEIAWPALSRSEAYSHSTRIRAFRQAIAQAYAALGKEQRGRFAQIVLKAILKRVDGDGLRIRLTEALSDIGWVIENDQLVTEDALLSEQFFAPNTEFDAYITIREILSRATKSIVIVDGYIGRGLLLTLGALVPCPPSIRILTVERNLPADFRLEVAAFRAQLSSVTMEFREATSWHDRFIVIDNYEFYHVGASIKDAGKRAFMISRIQDRPNVEMVSKQISQHWASSVPITL